jgi:hypothetical protein
VNDYRELQFKLPGGEWQLSFSSACIQLLEKHSQRRWYQKESVGQLFTKHLFGLTVRVDKATVLTPKMSSRTGVTFDAFEAMYQRSVLLADGYHCIGLWHTHPAVASEPSRQDECLAADHAIAARSVLNGLAFVIVAEQAFPTGWYIGLHDGAKFHPVHPISD